MLDQVNFLAYQERHKDLLREAEKERLVKIALSALRVRKAEDKAKIPQSEESKTEGAACCETVAT